MSRFLASLFVLLFLAAPATAQTGEPALTADGKSLPIAVALLYDKLLNRVPDYSALVLRNPALEKAAEGFGQAAVMKQQMLALRDIYQTFDEETVLYSRKLLSLEAVNRDTREIAFKDITPETHFAFTAFPGETYGVFIRNLDALKTITPPYLIEDLKGLHNITRQSTAQVEAQVVLKPVAADPNDFILADETPVKVILADIVEIKLLRPTANKILLQKRFNDWRPVNESTLIDSEMMDALEEKLNK